MLSINMTACCTDVRFRNMVEDSGTGTYIFNLAGLIYCRFKIHQSSHTHNEEITVKTNAFLLTSMAVINKYINNTRHINK